MKEKPLIDCILYRNILNLQVLPNILTILATIMVLKNIFQNLSKTLAIISTESNAAQHLNKQQAFHPHNLKILLLVKFVRKWNNYQMKQYWLQYKVICV